MYSEKLTFAVLYRTVGRPSLKRKVSVGYGHVSYFRSVPS